MPRMTIESLNIGFPRNEYFFGKEITTGICKQPHLVWPAAPYYQGADVLLTADCIDCFTCAAALKEVCCLLTASKVCR